MIYMSVLENKKFQLFLDPIEPQLSEKELLEAENLWSEKSKLSPLWHNGFNFGCERVGMENNSITLHLNKLSYKTYTWAKTNKVYRPGLQNSGIVIFIINPANNKYVFFERYSNVGFDLNKISAIGGSLKYTERPTEDVKDLLLNQVKEELGEELGVETIDKTETKPFGLFFDESTYKLNFSFIAKLENPTMRGVEHIRRIELTLQEVMERFLAPDGEKLFEASTRNHLPFILGDEIYVRNE